MLTSVFNSYAQFFNFTNLWAVISNPGNWGLIFSLIILEGLLSSDNALVLATMVSHLKGKQRRMALFAGIWGAYFFRFLVIGFGVYLIHFWWIKVFGALYLLWMTAKYFFFNGEEEDDESAPKTAGSFWRTVLKVELMDIAFSVDSISAAFGVSEKVWVLFLGAIFGILMMRGVAQIFVTLIEKFPEFETTAYVLIGIIGLKMLASVLGFTVSEWVFFACLVVVFVSTFVVHYLKLQKGSNKMA